MRKETPYETYRMWYDMMSKVGNFFSVQGNVVEKRMTSSLTWYCTRSWNKVASIITVMTLVSISLWLPTINAIQHHPSQLLNEMRDCSFLSKLCALRVHVFHHQICNLPGIFVENEKLFPQWQFKSSSSFPSRSLYVWKRPQI